MSLIKYAAKMPYEISKLFKENLANGLEPRYAAAKAYLVAKSKNIELTKPIEQIVKKEEKKIVQPIQQSLFDTTPYEAIKVNKRWPKRKTS